MQQAAAAEPGTLRGTVTTAALEPLEGARVRVDGTTQVAQTDATGAFAFTLPPGEHLVLAALEGYHGQALRARVESGASATLRFTLPPVPTERATVEVAEKSGLVSCAARLNHGSDSTQLNCGARDPNARTDVAFAVPAPGTMTGMVLEVVWEPTTQGSKVLQVTLLSGDAVVAVTEGEEHVSVQMPARILANAFPGGGDLVVRIEPAGSFTDEEAAIDAGLDVQQTFTAYASTFHHQPAPSGYTVVHG